MKKLIRKTYPPEFSFALLLLIFVFASFLSAQIFNTPIHNVAQVEAMLPGLLLGGLTVIIMILIIWEEILFPLRVKLVTDGMVFRNHRNKIKIQVLIYFTIPIILCFIYLTYPIHMIRFVIWSAVCIIPPIIEKIGSGLNNYNDFLKLTTHQIDYKNNEKEGTFFIIDIEHVSIIKDNRDVLSKIVIVFKNSETVIIDLDEMELEAFYDYINRFITNRYKELLIQS